MGKNKVNNYLLLVVVFMSIFLVGAFIVDTKKPGPIPEIITVVELVEPERIDWELFTFALILHESKDNDMAVGPTGDAGCLQFTKIAVDDANRILGLEKFTLGDRFSREKSLEMFNIIQGHYNPKHDPQLALKIHNPLAPLSYHTEVMKIYNELYDQKRFD